MEHAARQLSQHDSIALSCPLSQNTIICDGNCLPKKDKLCLYVRLRTCKSIMCLDGVNAAGRVPFVL
jgi:hypothetical protein